MSLQVLTVVLDPDKAAAKFFWVRRKMPTPMA